MDDARRLLSETFPGFEAAWFGADERDGRRVDAFSLPFAQGDRCYYVLSILIDGEFVADVASEYPHIPYDAAHANAKPPRSGETGVFVHATEVHSPGAEVARFAHRGAERSAAVLGGYCALFDWDTPWIGCAGSPRIDSLLIGGEWLPTVSSFVAATPQDFARAYADRYRRSDGPHGADWAVQSFFEDGSFEEKLAMVEAVLDFGGLTEFGRGCLAAGPIEDLIGDELLDHATRDAESRARWVPLLRMTYWSSEPPHIQSRLRELLG